MRARTRAASILGIPLLAVPLLHCQPQATTRDAADAVAPRDATVADASALERAGSVDRVAGDDRGSVDASVRVDASSAADRWPGGDAQGGTDRSAAADVVAVADAAAGVDRCVASCTSRSCGDDDGCGGRCRTCPGAGEICDTQSWSCAVPCVADCSGKLCGELDGCGGRCSACPSASEGCNPSTWSCEACALDCNGHGQCFVRDGTASCSCEDGYYHRLVESTCEPAAGTACDGVSCSGHGTCLTAMWGGVSCACDPGYRAYGLSCTREERWGCRDRDGAFRARGSSRCSDDNTVIESCRDADGDGDVEWAFGATPSCAAGPTCADCIDVGCNVAAGGQPCALEQYCLQSTHEMELWICVESCDCTNCGDCGLGDGCYQGMQAFCGSCSSAPATTACRWPCSNAGDGCIPYSDPQTGAVGLCYPMEGCFSAPPSL